ncbi:hypothetical protein BHM03_00027606 [Ensete ventricosum]|nr:hypothetical protein BHM03_00027606 [Ensete ventricosum]
MASRPRHWHWITHKPRGLRLALFFRGFVPGLLFGNLVPVKLLKAVAPAVEVEKSSLLKLDPPTVSKKILWWILLVEAIDDDEEETFLDNGSESERRHRADTGRRMFLKAPPKAISISRKLYHQEAVPAHLPAVTPERLNSDPSKKKRNKIIHSK